MLPLPSSSSNRKTSRTALLFLRSFLSTAFLASFLSRGSQRVCVGSGRIRIVCVCVCVRACVCVSRACVRVCVCEGGGVVAPVQMQGLYAAGDVHCYGAKVLDKGSMPSPS